MAAFFWCLDDENKDPMPLEQGNNSLKTVMSNNDMRSSTVLYLVGFEFVPSSSKFLLQNSQPGLQRGADHVRVSEGVFQKKQGSIQAPVGTDARITNELIPFFSGQRRTTSRPTSIFPTSTSDKANRLVPSKIVQQDSCKRTVQVAQCSLGSRYDEAWE